MFSNELFSLGDAGPILFLFMGPAVIGFAAAGTAFIARLRAMPEATQGDGQSNIDLAIGIFAVSGPLAVLGMVIYHLGNEVGMMLAIAATFILWPLSALLAYRARGVGRKEILVGSGVIGIWVVELAIITIAH